MAVPLEPKPSPGTAPWWLARRITAARRRPRADGLTMDRICEAALQIAERDGLEALTMRRVADELGTGPASLYRHVAGQDELRVELVDYVLGKLSSLPSRESDWRATAEWGARQMRGHLLEHSAIMPLLGSAQLLGPNSMVGREFALRLLVDAGLSAEDAVRAYLAVTHFVFAEVQQDIRHAARNRTQRRALRELFASQDEERFPTVVACADALAQHSSDEEFEFGLQALLDRIAAMTGRARD
jgi:AcrR family transcriptional regulator